MLDVAGIDTNLVTDDKYLTKWVKSLVNEIEMVAYGEPQVVHFGNGDLAGWTVMQLITTSNINAHFNDVDGSAYVDIFSCCEFDIYKALDHFKLWFNPKTTRHNFLIRQS